MLILHKPRTAWDLSLIEFDTWQAAVESLMLHIVNNHLEHHDDQLPEEDKALICFNRDEFFSKEMRMLYGPYVMLL